MNTTNDTKRTVVLLASTIRVVIDVLCDKIDEAENCRDHAYAEHLRDTIKELSSAMKGGK